MYVYYIYNPSLFLYIDGTVKELMIGQEATGGTGICFLSFLITSISNLLG